MKPNTLREHPALKLLDDWLYTNRRKKPAPEPVPERTNRVHGVGPWENGMVRKWKREGRINDAGFMRISGKTKHLSAVDIKKAFPHLRPEDAAEVAALLVRE